MISKITMIGTPVCPKCESMKPKLVDYCKENSISFEYMNLKDSSSEIKQLLKSKKVMQAPVLILEGETLETPAVFSGENALDELIKFKN